MKGILHLRRPCENIPWIGGILNREIIRGPGPKRRGVQSKNLAAEGAEIFWKLVVSHFRPKTPIFTKIWSNIII